MSLTGRYWCDYCKGASDHFSVDHVFLTETLREPGPNSPFRQGGPVRTFETGATRDTEEGKLDYEGFLSPAVLKRYAEYMHEHRLQKDGTMRASDNWQKGMPLDVYIKSLFRHFMDLWQMHRHGVKLDASDAWFKAQQDALCAIMFNAMGYLERRLKGVRE
jgi:hypothetical protein